MKRTSIAALALLSSLTALSIPGCSSEATSTPTPTAGAPSTAGTPALPAAGTPSTGGAPTGTAGSTGSAGTPAAGGTNTAGTTSGGASTAGAAGTASAGASGSAGAAGTGAGGTGGGTPNPACPAKIDSTIVCTMAITCPAATCGVFKIGEKDCNCAAASGNFTCTSCSYAGKTEDIVQPPAAALAACTADDTTLEKNTATCTKGERCKSLDTAKSRFCACWDDPVKGGAAWDCDAMPSNWPK